jgi:hypothetical protein
MNITRIDQAPEYLAPNHFDMQCLRLQGREAGPAVQLWMGMSILKPGGHTTLDDSPIEKHYVWKHATSSTPLTHAALHPVRNAKSSTTPSKKRGFCWPCLLIPPLLDRHINRR